MGDKTQCVTLVPVLKFLQILRAETARFAGKCLEGIQTHLLADGTQNGLSRRGRRGVEAIVGADGQSMNVDSSSFCFRERVLELVWVAVVGSVSEEEDG